MKVSFSGNMLKVECLDSMILEAMQNMMDGSKVRCKPEIIIPFKAGIHLENFKSYGIEYEGVSEVAISQVKVNNQKRIINIARIKAQYDKEISFDYDCKGIYPPLKHQKVMFNAVYYTDCCALLAEPGTCKTAPYLWTIDKRIKKGKIKKALIVTLSDLKENVFEEIKKQTHDISAIVLKNLSQTKKIINKEFKSNKKNIDYNIYIANYESMASITEILPENYFDMIVLDEAHRVGSPRSNQTKAIINTFENTPYKYVVTGTFLLEACRLNRIAVGCDNSEENVLIAEKRGCHVQR